MAQVISTDALVLKRTQIAWGQDGYLATVVVFRTVEDRKHWLQGQNSLRLLHRDAWFDNKPAVVTSF